MEKNVIVFDTTLRDGEQSPGASMTLQEKLRVARALATLRVDVIEAGFPIASQGDFDSVSAIAREIEGPTICALARCAANDIDRAWNALKESFRPRLHVFLATSPLHREHKLRMSKTEVIERAVEGVKRARDLCEDVEFSPEDGSRTEPDFLIEVVERVIEAGAGTVNIPDTVGYAVPEQFGALIRKIKKEARGADQAAISVHCHDDLGLAVSNTLAALAAGATQAECTINGLGERAGNAALEELVMALSTRKDVYGLITGIDTKRLCETSQLVSEVTGMAVARNKAIVGANAFAHEAGIHQHGVIAHQGTYEIMRPENVGFRGTSLVLGKHSGRHALRHRVEQLGYMLADVELDEMMDKIKTLADKKEEIDDNVIKTILFDQKISIAHTGSG